MSGRAAGWSRAELLATVLAGTVGDARCIAVGAVSPIPAAAALLVRETAPKPVDVIILGSTRHYPFSDGGREIFDFAGRGRIDLFFLGGGQIDGAANINLVGAGAYETPKPRFPGSFGSAYLYYLVPRVILFREEHSRRVLVPKVDFVSAPGAGPEGAHRPGGPAALVTGRARFAFDRERRRFRLETVHPGETATGVAAATGFDFDLPEQVPETPAPTARQLAILRGVVRQELADVYPEFVREQLAGAEA